ncbi:hypothetical protein ACFWJW_34460 [Streptomyces sp. NPDC127097]|uniref:integrin alpha n=1 Tax=Streptomyces sp. NPDC127097 TaxID=3347136 RepID=UPI003667A5DE
MVSSDPTKNWPVKLPSADGHTGRIGDVNAHGYGDLITGIAEDGTVDGERAPTREARSRSPTAAPAASPSISNPASSTRHPGTPGAAELADRFGQSLSTGHINADGYDDVLVGVPGEAIGDRAFAGGAVVLYGSAGGLTTDKSTAYSQDPLASPEVPKRTTPSAAPFTSSTSTRTARRNPSWALPPKTTTAASGPPATPQVAPPPTDRPASAPQPPVSPSAARGLFGAALTGAQVTS